MVAYGGSFLDRHVGPLTMPQSFYSTVVCSGGGSLEAFGFCFAVPCT